MRNACRAALAIGGGLLTIAALDKRLRHSPRLWLAGLVLGAGVVLGWAATGVLVDAFSPQRPQSLTFVAPVARGLHALILGTGGWLEFSVMSAPGVALGSALAAWIDPRLVGRRLQTLIVIAGNGCNGSPKRSSDSGCTWNCRFGDSWSGDERAKAPICDGAIDIGPRRRAAYSSAISGRRHSEA